ncbi:MAG: peptidylprolyl isomerase [Pseudobdellovibrionaceae bacterium]|nr:peptidylprolyl isomerase [Bdellovibrionales bacterium]USN46601.1 MAG: peptidylprolyl isomerase [Pseudobdellovibrionaceae bacterium]
MKATKGMVVTMDYTLTNDQGEVLDSSKGREPLPYLHGHRNIITGLEKVIEGKAKGDQLNVKVAPAEGYGERDESLVQVVPKSEFEGAGELEVGMQFQTHTQDGLQIFQIVKIAGEDVTVDGNHPLAGESLHFEVTITDVREATPEELSHGHVHGPGGHHH